MARDAEQRIIAYSLLIVAAVTAVGWFAWIVTATDATGVVPLVVAGAIVGTLLSVPASVVGVLLADRTDADWTTASRATALLVLLLVFGATVYGFVAGVGFGLIAFGALLALVAFLALVPLSIGAVSAATGDVSMIGVCLAWPPANLLAVATFLAPGSGGIDFATQDALSLAEPLRSVVLLSIVATVAFGPTLLGRVIDRFITVRVPVTPE